MTISLLHKIIMVVKTSCLIELSVELKTEVASQ
jgi:hypothetical protein